MITGETETDILGLGFALGFRMQTLTCVGRTQILPEILVVKQRPDYQKVFSLQDPHILQQHLPSN